MIFQLFVFISCVLSVEAVWPGESRIEPHAEISTECLNHGTTGACDFFWCMEGRFPCGRNGYAINMLADTCDRANMNIHRFNVKGQRWMNRTAKCITERLIPMYNASVNRCGDIQNVAVDAYLTCQASVDDDGYDLCTFTSENSQPYRDIFGVQGFSQIFQLRHPRVAGSYIYNNGRCRARELQTRVNTLTEQVEEIVETAFAAMADSWNGLWS